MILLSDGLYISPMPFLWARLVPLPAKRRGDEPQRPSAFSRVKRENHRPRAATENDKRECSALSTYQMGCLAQQMSIGGFDAGAVGSCGCERSNDHCIARLR